jgi:hypothetical protein
LGQTASETVRNVEKQMVPGPSPTVPTSNDAIGTKTVEGQVKGVSPAPKPNTGGIGNPTVKKLEKQVLPGSRATVPTTGSPTKTIEKVKPDVVPGASSLGGAASKVIGN